jgi:tetratricopeptide (TPR) repeat protein
LKFKTLLLVTLLFVAGCAQSINLKNAQNYYDAGINEMRSGNWEKGRMYLSRAIGNAKLGGAGPRTTSLITYEYGRASGVVCEWAEAEKSLKTSYELDLDHDGPYWMPMVELTRMSRAQKDHQKALGYYSELMPILKDIQAETQDPLGYADILEEYAESLEQTGSPEKGTKLKERAKQLRETFPGMVAHTEKTPYGTQCQK